MGGTAAGWADPAAQSHKAAAQFMKTSFLQSGNSQFCFILFYFSFKTGLM